MKRGLSMKKLIDEMPNTYNSQLFEDIRNIVKTEIPLENLDLKNPENLKLFEQLYNTDALKNVLNKNKAENILALKEKYENNSASQINHITNSHSSKISSHKSFFGDSSTNKRDLHSHSTKDNLDFSTNYMHNSPLLPKEICLYGSPNNVHNVRNGQNGRGQQHKNLYDEFYHDENIPYGNFSNRNYGYANDNYMFNSPPMKKVKVAIDPSPNMLEYNESNSNFHLVNKDKSSIKPLQSQDWLNQAVKGQKNSQVGFTRTQMFHNSAMIYSPINTKYESPSR